jgi:tRNA modification GTPase
VLTGIVTRFRKLTPEGRGALSVLEVWGAQARPTLSAALDRSPPRAGQVRLRYVRSGQGLADQVLVAALDTGRFELSGHAGPAVVDRVMQALVTAGAVEAPAQSPTPLQQARTLLAAGLFAAIQAHQLDGEDPFVQHLSRCLNDPARVVFLGAVNAGKSSLLNALLERPHALTSETPGTTRDVVTANTAFHGVPFELRDTAGLRTVTPSGPKDELEILGMQRTQAEAKEADLRLIVIDSSEPIPAATRLLLEAHDLNTIVVLTKCDLIQHAGATGLEFASSLRVSSRTGEGLEALKHALASRRLGVAPETLPFA